MKITQKILRGVLIIITISVIFWAYSKNSTLSEFTVEISTSELAKTSNTPAYNLTVFPSKNSIFVGDCLYFTGTVTNGGKPVKGLEIGVEDPIKQQTIASGTRTDANGKFIYTVDNMCPVIYNNRVGVFEFKFFAGSTIAKSKVTVNATRPSSLDELIAVNNGPATYKIKLLVNNQDKGTFTIFPGQTVRLFQDKNSENSTIVATVINSSGNTLWKATYTSVLQNSPQSTTFLNPFYNNYWAYTNVSLYDTSKSRIINGIGKFYTDYVNKEWSVGGIKVVIDNNVTSGVATKAELGVEGPGCETFLGLKYSCTASCGASIGLQFCFGKGIGWAIGPGHVGCTAKCCVEVASVKCNVAEFVFSSSAEYK